MTKVCTGCKEEKDLEEYHKQSTGKLGRCSRCKDCYKTAIQPGGTQHKSYVARSSRNNAAKRVAPDYSETNKRNNLRRYNITLEQYNEMRAQQNYRCALCPRHESEFARGLHVDHDHNCCPGSSSCGKCIRGLLCHGCNTALGAVNDSTDVLMAMVRYLS